MWSMKSPMCCIRLQSGIKFIAFIDLLVAAFLFIASIGSFLYYENKYQEAIDFLNHPTYTFSLFFNFRNVEATTIRILLSFCLFYYLQKVALGFILFFAAVRESKFMLRLWVIYTLVLLIFHILVYLALLCLAMMEPWTIPVYVGGFLVREYFMWCATTYLHRLTCSLTDEDDDLSCDGDNDRYSYKL